MFVTGATGFFGPLLVSEILHAFPSHVLVYCLVRASSDAQARERLQMDMQRASVWPDKESTRDRLRVLRGDLAAAQLGLTDAQHQELTGSIAHVFHSGACVNMTLPYRALRAANVEGTVEVIRMSVRAGARLHYISSVCVNSPGTAFKRSQINHINDSNIWRMRNVLIMLSHAHALKKWLTLTCVNSNT